MGSKGQKVAPLQTALDGRPRAGANCGENGIGIRGGRSLCPQPELAFEHAAGSQFTNPLQGLFCLQSKRLHRSDGAPRDESKFLWTFFLFFLHCRASARHGRSTAGILSRIEIKFPWKQETNQEHKQNTNKQHPHTSQGTRQSYSARKCKLSETR